MNELEKYQPNERVKRLNAFVSLFYLLCFLTIGIPIWYLTTSTYRATLPINRISDLENKIIVISTQINMINFDSHNDIQQLGEFEETFFNEINKMYSSKDKIKYEFKGFIRNPNKLEIESFYNYGKYESLDRFEENIKFINTEAINIFLLPNTNSIVRNNKNALLRGQSKNNIVYLNTQSSKKATVDTLIKVISGILIRGENFKNMYYLSTSVPDKKDLDNLSSNVKKLLTQIRTTNNYNLLFSMIVPNPTMKSATEPEWNFSNIKQRFLNTFLKRFVNIVKISISSQILYGLNLESIWPSKLKNHNTRFYYQEDLTHIVNGVETFIGSNSSLNFVAYLASRRNSSDAIIKLDKGSKSKLISEIDAFTVPKWGGMIFLNEIESVEQKENLMMTIFINQMLKLMGLSIVSLDELRRNYGMFEFESAGDQLVTTWELHDWLRRKTVENIAITRVTLTSVKNLLDTVVNMVIRDDVALSISSSTDSALQSLELLANSTKSDQLLHAFKLSKIALNSAESAFFHQSLLELLYFQDDQKYGIYIPLFFPILSPILFSIKKISTLIKYVKSL